MIADEAFYIKQCKYLIEKELGWPNCDKWRQRDYLNLIQLLENKTGITLSLSTIKRIWKFDYEGIPHPSTLDAFALFLGYKNWLEFREKNQQLTFNKKEDSLRNKRFIFGHNYKKAFVLSFFIILFSVIIFVFFQFRHIKRTSNELTYNPDEVTFSCNNSVSRGVPTTVIFSYDASKITADSIFIQQSWINSNRERVQKEDHTLTSIYYYPGYHKAKLIANDSIVKEISVQIKTNNWLSLVRYGGMDQIPICIRNKDVINNGKLHVSRDHLITNNVDINKDIVISYYYVDEFKGLSSSDFSFETKVKCDSIVNIVCPGIGIGILGKNSLNIIRLSMNGCIGNSMIKLGNVMQYGKNNDLSSFGVNVYKWQQLKVQVKKKVANIYINNKHVYKIDFTEDIGEIIGFGISCSGMGSVDYVKLLDKDNKVVYDTEFD